MCVQFLTKIVTLNATLLERGRLAAFPLQWQCLVTRALESAAASS